LFIEWRLKEVVVLVGELRFVIRIDGWGILPFGGGGGIDSGLSVECDGGGGGIIDWWHNGGDGLIEDCSDEFDCVEIVTIWSIVFIDGELTMGDDWSVLYCCIDNEWWYGGGGGGGGDSGCGGVVVGRREGGDIWSFLFNDVSNDKDCWTNDDIDCWVTDDSDDIDWAEGAVEVTRFGGFAGGIRFDDDDDDDDGDDDNGDDDDDDDDDSCDDDDNGGDDDDDDDGGDDDDDDDDNEDDFIADGYAGLGGLESFVE